MERINRFIRELSELQWLERRPLIDWSVTATEYRLPGDYSEPVPFQGSEAFALFPSVQGTTYFFRQQVDIPREWAVDFDNSQHAGGPLIGLVFESGGEGLLRVNGESWQGLDRNHTFVTLDPAVTSHKLQLEIELYDPIPEPVDPLNQQAVIQPPIRMIRSELVLANRAVQALMYTAIVVRDSLKLLAETDQRRARLTEALHAAMDDYLLLDTPQVSEGSAVVAIERVLAERVHVIGCNAEGIIHMVGQSHIDIAWLWPARETVRKASRTFSTVNALMEEYPGYLYTQSQPQLFAYLKDHDPMLYKKIKRRITEGRIELVGGMWVEPDLNIPSGESLMRQMLYGQRFYMEEFNRVSTIEWLPDTFGYCASLPQILRHGGIRYFMTTKLGWNDTNVFPYNLFHWIGIDGTAILSYLNHGVNENTLPKDVHDHYQSFREKNILNEQMLLYGHGDGGGGVTREMLESIKRSDLMVGQPVSKNSTAAEFFSSTETVRDVLPSWYGDLYLELHRGTYTTHGRNKRANRKAELLYREAELWQTLAAGLHGNSTMGMTAQNSSFQEALAKLHKGWKLILLNQFHDIIPGSAITEAYATSKKEYVSIFELGKDVLNSGLAVLAEQIDTSAVAGTPYIIFNGLGWARDIVAELWLDKTNPTVYSEDGTLLEAAEANGSVPLVDGEYVFTPQNSDATESTASRVMRILVPGVPAFGYRTVWVREGEMPAKEVDTQNPIHASSASRETIKDTEGATASSGISVPTEWETPFYKLLFNERGEIASLYDKEVGREVVSTGRTANRFYFFHDRPTLWDAWDIDSRYEQQPAGDVDLLESWLQESNPIHDVFGFRWKIGSSEIRQQMVLYRHDRRIDFRTEVDWNESHKLLKVGFPIDVQTTKATYEIPFGALERPTHRNTSWEQAQYEVCGHRFVDVAEHGYGVSLLNDSKYGYDVQGSTIRLSLLRAPKWPDLTADLGRHVFTYSLYPHRGDWKMAHTLRRAAELNSTPPVIAPGFYSAGESATISIADHGTAMNRRLPASGSLIPFTGCHVVLDTVKPAEDGEGVILRLYESAGGRETVEICWNGNGSGFVSNALEEELELLAEDEGRYELHFAPFEIKTIKLR
ncbi:alpha-mannosidase [Gorillibacterium massiliense]|uniref:alpha-mannosidase n=1 Tax=Gorillibacterium massiliense TaxID=1280390 RepID=UPI0004B26824|nr:glycoside hydrolase family 38 C-terminal domain-containing protein [Gorillibacterium massiliense]